MARLRTACASLYSSVCVCMCMCMYVRMHVCMCMHVCAKHGFACVCMCIYVRVYVHICVCVCGIVLARRRIAAASGDMANMVSG